MTVSKSVSGSVKYARDGKDRETHETKAIAQSGIGIDPANAEYQLRATAKAYGKTERRQAFNVVTSFEGKDISAEQALDVVREAYMSAQRQFNGSFPVALYVHGNTTNIHVHAVIGAIDASTGKKFKVFKPRNIIALETDKACLRRGLPVISATAETLTEIANETGKSVDELSQLITGNVEDRSNRAESQLEARGEYSWLGDLKERIQGALEGTVLSSRLSLRQFKAELAKGGVEARERASKFTYIFKDKTNKQRKVRENRLGGAYYEKETIERTLNELSESRGISEPERRAGNPNLTIEDRLEQSRADLSQSCRRQQSAKSSLKQTEKRAKDLDRLSHHAHRSTGQQRNRGEYLPPIN